MEESVSGKGLSIGHIVPENETLGHLIEEHGRESSSSSDFLTSETTGLEEEEHSHSGSEESSSLSPLSWSTRFAEGPDCIRANGADNRKLEKKVSSSSGNLDPLFFMGFLVENCVDLFVVYGVIEIEMMKERFSKLLLGEDMSGCGNGVCTALAISNAITNLCGMLCLCLCLCLTHCLNCYASSVSNIDAPSPCHSHSVWATMEIRASSIREESDVEKGDGLASLC